jgi:inhibitor of cysteine peptidase
MPHTTLTQADNHRSVEVALGEAIVLRLPENPTTGYRWAVDQIDPDKLLIQATQFSLLGAGAGAGGEKTLTLKANQPGVARLHLKLWREWEGEASIIDRYQIAIQINSRQAEQR